MSHRGEGFGFRVKFRGLGFRGLGLGFSASRFFVCGDWACELNHNQVLVVVKVGILSDRASSRVLRGEGLGFRV